MNTLFVLLDGAEDHEIPQFGGRKPMDVADIPFIRSAGRFHGRTDGRGYTHLFLNEFFTGKPPTAPRAVIEALGLGMDMDRGRTAYRLSPAVIGNGMVDWVYDLDDVHETLTEKVMDKMHMLDHLEPEIKFFLNGRAILTLRSDFVPELPGPPVPARYVDVPGELGAFMRSIANDLHGLTEYPWGCGKLPVSMAEPFIKHMNAVSNTPTALGVARSLGYDVTYVKDIGERVALARKMLDRGNVFLHIDEIDEYSHQKDPEKKVRVLERTDREMAIHFSGDDRIVFFVDHGTSSITGEHLIMDVPFMTSFGKDRGHVPLGDMIPTICGCDGKR